MRLTEPPAHAHSRHERAEDQEERDVASKTAMYNGYCVKCKEKRDFEGTVEVSKTGMKMAKGKCPVCGTTVNRILGKA
jgi:hypothetical protein